MANYRVGLIGCGGRQSAHVAAFRDVKNCEIVAAVDLVEEARQNFAQKYEIPATYASVEEMVQDARPDIVTVVTRPKWAYQPVADAIQAGVKGILMEKPFGVDIEDSKEMLKTAEASGTTLLVNHQYRFFDLTVRMREIVLSGELGEVEYFRAISAIKLHGQGTHMIDFVRFLYDDRPFAWALGNFAGKETFDAKQIGPDFDIGVITFDNGVPLYVESGRGSMRAPYPDNGLNLYADVVCTKGRIWFGLSHGLRIWWPDGRYEEIAGSWPEISEPAQVRLVESLIDTMENGTESRCHAQKAYATQEALCALLESALTHQKISFPLNIEPGLMERVRACVGA
ncbi:Gfo/Idh/MocA family oxidoreductase [Candidatus Poribacteria bacterium]|nr:Gfo/Idh/MocA family oxidoreductase [Candidatus Poribacteria bacterium]